MVSGYPVLALLLAVLAIGVCDVVAFFGVFMVNPIEIAAVVVWNVADMAGAIFEVDEERKAATVSKTVVVVWSDRRTKPIVNTGTLYQ